MKAHFFSTKRPITSVRKSSDLKSLKKAVDESSILEKFKKVIGFGLSNSPLYLNMEKPFNPILG